MLTSQDRAALSGCSKRLQHLIHSSITAVTVHQADDFKAVLMGWWPQLALVKLQPATNFAIDQQLSLANSSSFQLIASFEFSKTQSWITSQSDRTALVVNPHAQLNQRKSVAVAFGHLQEREYQQALALKVYVLSQAGEIIAQMGRSNWPCIEDLHLSHMSPNPAPVNQLANASQPSSDLSNSQLDEVAAASLTQGNWPLLTRLVVESSLSLYLDGPYLHKLTLLHNQLEHLALAYSDIDAAALSQIATSPWPQLQSLVLVGNRLQADAIASLALAQIPNLQHLDLGGNKLNAAAAKLLSKGSWLNLYHLALDYDDLNDAAMAFLADRHWPTLYTLSLNGNNTCAKGLGLLVAGRWPQLGQLTLSGKAVSEATWNLLNLSSDAMPAL